MYDKASAQAKQKLVDEGLTKQERKFLSPDGSPPSFKPNPNMDTLYSEVMYDKEKQPMGYIEIETCHNSKYPVEKKRAYVNVAVHKNYRGKGISSRLLFNGVTKIKQKYPQIKEIWYITVPQNIASQKLAAKSGFRLNSKTKDWVRYKLEV